MKAKITTVDNFKKSTDKNTAATFPAKGKKIDDDQEIEIDMISVKKILKTKRLSPDYIEIIKQNDFKGEISVKYNNKKNIYELSGDNSEFIEYLQNERQKNRN